MSSGPVPPAYQDLPAVHGDIVFRESDHTYWQGDPDGGERLLSATQVGKLAGLIDTRWFKPHHADRGTKIHKALEYFDQPTVRGVVGDAVANDYRWSSLILGIVKSPTFLMRAANTAAN